MKPQPVIQGNRVIWEHRKEKAYSNCGLGGDYDLFKWGCPYGRSGDHLWVRETFCLEQQVESDQLPPFSDGRPIQYWSDGIPCAREMAERWIQPHYKATDPTPELAYEDTDGDPTVRWNPSIHMPRWASRILLEITDIRVERVKDISAQDCVHEGILASSNQDPCDIAGQLKDNFRDVWNSIYAKKGFGWEVNPWVWVIEFRRISWAKKIFWSYRTSTHPRNGP